MKKLLFIFLLFPTWVFAQQAQPVNPVQVPQTTLYNEPSTGTRWWYNGATLGWYPLFPYSPPNTVLTGLSLSVVSSTLTVHTGTWRINNQVYTLGSNTTFTLQARDSVYSRYETVYATGVNNGIGLKVGVLSPTPIQPSFGADTLVVGSVLITPTNTTIIPPGPANEFVFSIPTVQQSYANPWVRTVRADTIKVGSSYILPPIDGASGQVMQTDGAGHPFWSNQAIYLPGFGLHLTGQTFSVDTSKIVTTVAMLDTLKKNAAHFNPTQFTISNDTISLIGGGGAFLPLNFTTDNTLSLNGHEFDISDTNLAYSLSNSSFIQRMLTSSSSTEIIQGPATLNMNSVDQTTGDNATIEVDQGPVAAFISTQLATSGFEKKLLLSTVGGNGIPVTDQIDNIGLNGTVVFPKVYGTQYAQYSKVDSTINAKIDSAITGGGVGTVTSITPGVGFLSHTPITSSGTMNVDTTVLQTVLNFFPKGDSRYYKSSNPSSYIALTAISATSPIFYNNSTGVISSQAASASQNGYLTSTDWSTFNGKGTGTVTAIGVTTANGVSGSSSGGATPNLTLTLGNITPATISTTIKPATVYQTAAGAITDSIVVKHSGGVVDAIAPATSAATASTIVSRDANVNTTVNNLIDGYATTATAAGTTTLTVASNYQQYFTGSTTQTVTLPVVSTLVLGQQYSITNLSSGTVTVNSSGANIVQAMTQNTIAIFTCIATTGTTATSWNVQYSSLTPGGTIAQNIQINNIQTTPTDALTLQNTTLSTSGVKLQYSPNLIFGGHAWNTGGAADTYNNFRIYQQMAGQFGYLNFDYSNSTTSTPSYTNVLQLDGNSRIASVNGTLSAGIVKSLGTAQAGGINSAILGANQTLALQNQYNFTTSGTFIKASNTNVTHSSGTFINFDINDKFTETSTAGDIDFTINRNEISLGSGSHQFASWMVGGVEKFGMLNTGQFTLPVILKNYTVSTLPTGVQGMVAYVTDALTPASLATVVGGGSSIVPVFYNGTNWIVQ